MNYCPTCWPADLGERIDGHCLDCGARILAATPGREVELLREQNAALQGALQRAMKALGPNRSGDLRRPALRLVHSASKKSSKGPTK